MVQLKPQFGKECFIALGGNFEETLSAMKEAIHQISKLPHIYNLASSRLYQTTPVSPIPQPHYLNACLRFNTTYSALTLFEHLEEIEKRIGKKKKNKNYPRLIDLDLLFYGNEVIVCEKLTVPHPRWKERLFVLRPLHDLKDQSEVLKQFENRQEEVVVPLELSLPYQVEL